MNQIETLQLAISETRYPLVTVRAADLAHLLRSYSAACKVIETYQEYLPELPEDSGPETDRDVESPHTERDGRGDQ